jgi:phosphonate transport system substrate-binding protein
MTTSPSSRLESASGSFGPRERSRFRRVVTIAGISGVLIVASAVTWIFLEMARAERGKVWAANRFGLQSPVQNKLDSKFNDANGDLIADPPAEEACIRPEVLRFAYIPDVNTTPDVDAWKPFLARLSEKIGMPVEYYAVDDVMQQLAAIKTGKLHIAGLNTGSVPQAVNACGFVPVSSKAGTAGDFSVRMKFITPVKSSIHKVTDIRKKYFTFTNNNSNSGCKLAIVTLLRDFNMLLGKDYDYRFSTSHDESIRLVKAGEVQLAAVASDMLDRAIAAKEIAPEDYREVYASDPIPSAAFGYVYNLAPDIASKVREALIDIDLSETPLGSAEGNGDPAKLVPIDYRRDFSAIREVDNMLGRKHEVEVLDIYDAIEGEGNPNQPAP